MPRYLLPIFLFVLILLVAGAMAGGGGGEAGGIGGVLAAWAQAGIIIPLLVAAAMLGLALTARLQFPAVGLPGGARLVLSTALGLGALSLATFAFGCLGWLRHGLPILLPVIAAVIGYLPSRRYLRQIDRAFWRAPMTRFDALFLLSAIPLAALALAATIPPGHVWNQEKGWYDVLEYHLQLPREYLAANSIQPLQHNAYSYLPANVEMLYTLVMSMLNWVRPGDYLAVVYPAQMLHAALVVLAAAAVGLAPLPLRTLGRVLAFLFMLATPWLLEIGSQAYNDGGMLLFGTLAILWTLSPSESKRLNGWRMGIVGVLLGLAVGCKLTAGVMVAAPVAAILLARRQWAHLALVTVVACLVYSPWALRDWHATGNPIFPIAARTLGLAHWSPQQADQWTKAHGATAGADSITARVGSLVQASLLDDRWSPAIATVQGWMSDTQTAPDANRSAWPWRLGMVWLLLPVALVLILRRGSLAWALLLVAAVQILAWMFLTHLQSRFLIPALVPLALCMGLAAGEKPAFWRILLGTAVALQAAMTALVLQQSLKPMPTLHPAPPHPPFAAAGLLAEYPAAFEYPEALLAHPPEITLRELDRQRVLLVGSATPFYYAGTVLYNTAWDRVALGDALRRGGPEEAARWLREQKIQYVVVDWSEVARLRHDYGYDESITPQAITQLVPLGLHSLEMASPGSMQVFEVK